MLQKLAAPDSSRLRRAVSPLLYIANTEWAGQCAVLHRVVGNDTARRGLLERRYSRYWHGYNAGVAFGLRAMEVGTLRRVLVAGVWVALAFFTFSMWRAAVGAGLTVAIKQLLAYALFDPGAGDAFFSHLRVYADMPSASAGRPGILLPFIRLPQRADVLTYGSHAAGYALVGFIAVAWIVGAVRAWRDRGVEGNVNRTVLLVAALMPLCWVLVLPKHTSIHAVFMVRILVASLALAPLAALWPVLPERRV